MKYLMIFAVLASGLTLTVQAAATTCSYGNNQRTIEVVYPNDGATACEVQYTKDDSMKVLWSAKADKDYCTEKAAALVEKQQGWGWSCESDMPAIESTEEVDDTMPVAGENDMSDEK